MENNIYIISIIYVNYYIKIYIKFIYIQILYIYKVENMYNHAIKAIEACSKRRKKYMEIIDTKIMKRVIAEKKRRVSYMRQVLSGITSISTFFLRWVVGTFVFVALFFVPVYIYLIL